MANPRLMMVVAATCAGMLTVTGNAVAGAPAGFVPFARNSVWNQPLRRSAPLSARSRLYVRYLDQTVAAHGAWVNTTSCGMPEYWAGPHTPTVSVTLDHPAYEDPALIQAWSAVPIPADARPATCEDQNFAVLQKQPDGAIREWEFWDASRSASGAWSAGWGGAIGNVLTASGFASPAEWSDPTAAAPLARESTYGWNVTASGASMIAGVITNSDLAAGRINHALAMAVTAAAARVWMWPAQRSDGYSTDPDAIPEGAHLRLNPALNLNALHLTPLVRMIAQAAQKYGIIVRDQTASADVFYAEPPAPGRPNPIDALLDGQSLSAAMASFPWTQLEVLRAPLCVSYSGCFATPRAVIGVEGTQSVGQTVTLYTNGSQLDFPGATFQWDLTGSGRYSSASATATSIKLTLTSPGRRRIRVRITCQNGTVVIGSVVLDVLPAA